MKYIGLGFEITEDLGLKSVTFTHNDTELPCNSKTLELIALALFRSIYQNAESLSIHDLLNDLDIRIAKE